MPVLRTILSRKGWNVVCVSPHENLLSLSDTLVEHHIGAVPVVDEAGALLGLVSERDIVTGLSKHHDEVTTLTAGDVMSRNLRTCSPDCSIMDAMQMMTTFRHRHIPVLDEGRLVGMVSIGDLVKYRLEEADLMLEQMRAYVMQSDPSHDSDAGQYATR